MATYTEGQLLIKVRWQGTEFAGPISVPGLKVGDRMLWLAGANSSYDLGTYSYISGLPSSWELMISVDDEIQQAGTNRQFDYLEALFLRNL